MTDETFDRLADFVRRNAVPAGEVFVYVDDEIPEDEPDLSEEPYALGIRLCRADYDDLQRRLRRLKEEEL